MALRRPRLIPVLLVKAGRLVKTRGFRNPIYVGDPINVLHILNEKEVDEVIILDIGATEWGSSPDLELAATLTSECFMPVCYGGGVASVATMRALFRAGVEKVAVNTGAYRDRQLLREAAAEFGRQSVVAAIDVKLRLWRGRRVVVRGGRESTGLDPVAYARDVANAGAGEILLTSVDRDGTFAGYDLDLVRAVAAAVDVPVIALGGAGTLEHLAGALYAGAAACAAGSLFVFQGPTRAVLIRYPAVSGWPLE